MGYLGRVCEVVSAREEALDKLTTFNTSIEMLVDTLQRLEGKVQNQVLSPEELSNWEKESQELQNHMQQCLRNGTGLDPVLQQAQLSTIESVPKRQRTTVKGYLNRLQARYERVLAEIAGKK